MPRAPSGARIAQLLLPPLILAAMLLVAGCGSAGRAPRAHAPAADACSPSVAAAVHATRTAAVDSGEGLTTCAYSGAAAVRVTVDTLPQAFRRSQNSEEERGQNTAGWKIDPAAQPQQIDGLGLGAYWVESQRTLYPTDGARLVTVTVGRARDARSVARTATRLSLGRVVEPP